MKTTRYRRKFTPTVDAMRFTGNNAGEINQWIGRLDPGDTRVERAPSGSSISVWCMNGRSVVFRGDWIVRDGIGYYVSWNNEAFRAAFEPDEET
jgi:hypothetical protein